MAELWHAPPRPEGTTEVRAPVAVRNPARLGAWGGGEDSGFRPPWWLASAHLQTLAAALVPLAPPVSLTYECHELPDGDFLELQWLGKARPGPVVVLLPGMQGSERSASVQTLLAALDRLGKRAVVLRHRGAHIANRLPGSYHAGFIEHLAWLVERLQRDGPEIPLHAVGFSLGGSILIRYLAEAGARAGFASCAAVSVTFDLNRTATRADQGFNRVYQQRVLRSYLRATHLKAHLPEIARRLPALAGVRSVRAFDGIVTAPVHGFSDAEDYYRQCSSKRFITAVRTPLQVLNAEDDPLAPADTLPKPSSLDACVHLEITRRGGHLGFVDRRGASFRPFMPGRLLPFLLQGAGT